MNKIAVHNLLAHGFKPKHKSDEADQALNYLRSILIHFPKTKQCVGNYKFEEWFSYLSRQEQFHPELLTTPFLIFIAQNYDIHHITLHIDEDLPITKKLVKTKKNLVIPISCFHKKIENGKEVLFDGHANMVLLNHNRKEFEWFEPNGHVSQDYKHHDQDTEFILKFRTFVEKHLSKWIGVPTRFKFHEPYDECVSFVEGPQGKADAESQKCTCIAGYCLTYSTIYAHLRFLAPDASGKETVDSLLSLDKNELLDLVQRYIGWQNSIGIENNGSTMIENENMSQNTEQGYNYCGVM